MFSSLCCFIAFCVVVVVVVFFLEGGKTNHFQWHTNEGTHNFMRSKVFPKFLVEFTVKKSQGSVLSQRFGVDEEETNDVSYVWRVCECATWGGPRSSRAIPVYLCAIKLGDEYMFSPICQRHWGYSMSKLISEQKQIWMRAVCFLFSQQIRWRVLGGKNYPVRGFHMMQTHTKLIQKKKPYTRQSLSVRQNNSQLPE